MRVHEVNAQNVVVAVLGDDKIVGNFLLFDGTWNAESSDRFEASLSC